MFWNTMLMLLFFVCRMTIIFVGDARYMYLLEHTHFIMLF
jgi:hypothetical protein